MKKIKVLIIDDHPIVMLGYKAIWNNLQSKYIVVLEYAQNFKEALLLIENKKMNSFDIVFLDISLPTFQSILFKKVICNGEDFGKILRRTYPNLKIVIQTALVDQHRIRSIQKSIKPEGFLIKTDINEKVLIDVLFKVYQGCNYLSTKAKKLVKKDGKFKSEIDQIDQEILYYLSIGEKTKDLTNHIPLSLASIERKKKKLKLLLGAEGSNTKELLNLAKKKGYIL